MHKQSTLQIPEALTELRFTLQEALDLPTPIPRGREFSGTYITSINTKSTYRIPGYLTGPSCPERSPPTSVFRSRNAEKHRNKMAKQLSPAWTKNRIKIKLKFSDLEFWGSFTIVYLSVHDSPSFMKLRMDSNSIILSFAPDLLPPVVTSPLICYQNQIAETLQLHRSLLLGFQDSTSTEDAAYALAIWPRKFTLELSGFAVTSCSLSKIQPTFAVQMLPVLALELHILICKPSIPEMPTVWPSISLVDKKYTYEGQAPIDVTGPGCNTSFTYWDISVAKQSTAILNMLFSDLLGAEILQGSVTAVAPFCTALQGLADPTVPNLCFPPPGHCSTQHLLSALRLTGDSWNPFGPFYSRFISGYCRKHNRFFPTMSWARFKQYNLFFYFTIQKCLQAGRKMLTGPKAASLDCKDSTAPKSQSLSANKPALCLPVLLLAFRPTWNFLLWHLCSTFADPPGNTLL